MAMFLNEGILSGGSSSTKGSFCPPGISRAAHPIVSAETAVKTPGTAKEARNLARAARERDMVAVQGTHVAMMRLAVRLERSPGRILAAMSAGTLQPKPRVSGIIDWPGRFRAAVKTSLRAAILPKNPESSKTAMSEYARIMAGNTVAMGRIKPSGTASESVSAKGPRGKTALRRLSA